MDRFWSQPLRFDSVDWVKSPPSERAKPNAELTEEIRDIHLWSRGTYYSPRVHAELRSGAGGWGKNRVARLMWEAGLRGVIRRQPVTTTRRDAGVLSAPDLVDWESEASGRDWLWVVDIAYVSTTAGFFYLRSCWTPGAAEWSAGPWRRT